MKIRIMSKLQAIQHSFQANIPTCAIISINSSKKGTSHKPFFDLKNPNLKAIMYSYFDDVRPEQLSNPELYTLFDYSKTHAIIDFVDKWKDSVEELIIHCHAGVSRSSAVAAAVSLYLGMDDLWIWTDGRYRPNTFVFETMCSKIGIHQDNIKQRYRLNSEALENIEYNEIILSDVLEELTKKKAIGCGLCNGDHEDFNYTTYISYKDSEDGFVLYHYNWDGEYDESILTNLKCCPICKRDLQHAE